MRGSTDTIQILLIVFVGLAVAGLSIYFSINIFEALGRIAGLLIQTEAQLKDTSQQVELCGDFYQDLFREDLYTNTYQNKFSATGISYSYLQTKTFCGALLEIVNAGNSGGDVNRTILKINEDYSKIYSGFQLDSEILTATIKANEAQIWLMDAGNAIKAETEGRVPE